MHSVNFLFRLIEFLRVEKLAQGNVQTVANFFDRRNCGVLAFFIDNVIQGRLRNAADRAQFVHRDMVLFAECKYPFSDQRTCFHSYHSKYTSFVVILRVFWSEV